MKKSTALFFYQKMNNFPDYYPTLYVNSVLSMIKSLSMEEQMNLYENMQHIIDGFQPLMLYRNNVEALTSQFSQLSDASQMYILKRVQDILKGL